MDTLVAASTTIARLLPTTGRAWFVLLLLALMTGAGLRLTRLEEAPPGFFADEALFGYDAYSIGLTGRDHHGNLMPVTIQGFNTYNMPLFCYSLVPLVAGLGLKPWVVRLGIVLWGCADLIAMSALGGLMFGVEGAAMAAVLGALTPWHLGYSRIAQEVMTAPATVDAAMVCLFAWLSRKDGRWLLVSGALFGVSLYSYSITKVFVPGIIALVALLYWRETIMAGWKAGAAIMIVLAFALPQAIVIHRHPETLGLFRRFAVLDSGHARGSELAAVASSLLAYFRPAYLFLTGDSGVESVWRPPGFGMLLPEQAVLIVLGLIAGARQRYRRVAILLLGWLILGALPGALARLPPHSARRGIMDVAPWTLLSVLGFVELLRLTSHRRVLRTAAISALSAGLIFHAGRFLRAYFSDYPIVVARDFKYGVAAALNDVDRLARDQEPVIVGSPGAADQGYIYVLFFDHYPPRRFQTEPVLQLAGGRLRWSPGRAMASTPPDAAVMAFGRYYWANPDRAYVEIPHGVFVFSGDEPPPAKPVSTIHYPDGTVAYYILVK